MGLSRSEVVRAALEVLDEVGADALTLRRIADALHVKAPALYWHFSSKKDLTDEVATELMRQVIARRALEAPGGGWREELGADARVLRAVVREHRDGARVLSGSQFTDVEVIRSRERSLAQLVDAGLTLRDAALATSSLRDLVLGFVIEEQEVFDGAGAAHPSYDAERRAEKVDPGRFPLTARSGPTAWGSADDRFETAIGFLLDGIESRTKSRL